MDVLTVLVLTLIAVRLAVLVVRLSVPPAVPPSRPEHRMDPCLGPFDLPAPPAPAPASAEGELVRRLAAGSLPPRQYHGEMARLAAEDAVRHPVELPPDR